MTVNLNIGNFPARRMRRLRRTPWLRELVQENQLSAADLIYPVFLLDGANRIEPVSSMPGVSRHSLDKLMHLVEKAVKLGIPAIALFPVIAQEAKTADGAQAWNADGLVPRAVAAIKREFPQIGLICDVALDPYTTHGQDGLIDADGYILNDETSVALCKQALTQAQAGVDIVAPSDMMDGRIGAIRNALDQQQFIHTAILAYSA